MKRAAGYLFRTYKGDHLPLHVHICKDRKEIGWWDIENQRPMDNFEMGQDLKNALKQLGYLLEEDNDNS